LSRSRIGEWDERYRAGEQVFRDPAPLVVQFTRDLTPGAALDLACGPGRNALYLAQRAWRVTAVDGSPVAIDMLLARARERQVSLSTQVADLESGEWRAPGDAFDLVLSCYFLNRGLIPVMRSALRRGGLLILIAHLADADQRDQDQPRGTRSRAFPGELRELFKDWRILHYREGTPGESCHRRAVAELVAQKPA
jgi:tellurite methyltransferase